MAKLIYKNLSIEVADKDKGVELLKALKALVPGANGAMKDNGETIAVSAMGSTKNLKVEAWFQTQLGITPSAPAPATVATPSTVPATPVPATPAVAPAVAVPVAPPPAASSFGGLSSIFGRVKALPQVEETWSDDEAEEAVPVAVPPPAPVLPAVVVSALPASTPAVQPPPPPAPSAPAQVIAQTSTKAEAPVVKALREAVKPIEQAPLAADNHPQAGKLLREKVQQTVTGSVPFDSAMTVKEIADVAVDGTKFFDFATKASLLATLNEQVANPDTARFVALANIVHKDAKKAPKGTKKASSTETPAPDANQAPEALVGVHFHYPQATNVGSKDEGGPELAEVQQWVLGGYGRLTEAKYGTKEAAIIIAFDQMFDRWNNLVKFSEESKSGLPSRLIVGTNFARAAAILTGRKVTKMEESRELYWYANHIFDKFKAINVEVSVVYTSDDGKGDCEEDLYGEVLAAHGKMHYEGRVEKRNFKSDDPLGLVELLSWHGANFARCLETNLPALLAGTKKQSFVIRQ